MVCTTHTCADCSIGLRGEWVPINECSNPDFRSEITEEICRNNNSILVTDENFVKCIDCSPGNDGEAVPQECRDILQCPNELHVIQENSDGTIQCVDCEPGRIGYEVPPECRDILGDCSDLGNYVLDEKANGNIRCYDCNAGLAGARVLSICDSIIDESVCNDQVFPDTDIDNIVLHQTQENNHNFITCVDCSPGLSGDWVDYSACGSVITDSSCPVNTVPNMSGDSIRCYDCSPGLSYNYVNTSMCSSVITDSSCPDNSIAVMNGGGNLTRCYDCTPGLSGDYVDSDCSSVITCTGNTIPVTDATGALTRCYDCSPALEYNYVNSDCGSVITVSYTHLTLPTT